MIPTVKIDAREIDALVAAFPKMPAQMKNGIVWSINRVGRTAFVRVRRTVSKQTGIPQSKLEEASRGLKAIPASYKHLGYVIHGRGRFTPLAYFDAREVAKRGRGKTKGPRPKIGVSARPWGKRRTFRGTFILNIRGHVGVYRRVGPRVGGKPAPIKELWGPSLPRELVRHETPDVFRTTFESELPRVLSREINRRLDNMNKRARA